MKCVLLFLCTISINIQMVLMRYATLERTIAMMSTKFVPEVSAKMCLLKPDMGPCRSNIKMYFFNPETMACESFTWGGCQGNGNRFDDKKECQDKCVTKPNAPRSRPRYCYLTFDYGFCFGAVKRWYYDKLWKVCKERLYSGCGGNKNNFYNFEQCDSICRLAKGSKSRIEKSNTGGIRKVVYVYTNGTLRSRITTPRARFTSPGPRRPMEFTEEAFAPV